MDLFEFQWVDTHSRMIILLSIWAFFGIPKAIIMIVDFDAQEVFYINCITFSSPCNADIMSAVMVTHMHAYK